MHESISGMGCKSIGNALTALLVCGALWTSALAMVAVGAEPPAPQDTASSGSAVQRAEAQRVLDAPASEAGDVTRASVEMPRPTKPLAWHTDYDQAVRQAKSQRRMLLCYFRPTEADGYVEAFEREALTRADIREQLDDLVLVRLPLDVEILVDNEPQQLLEHGAFSELSGQQGLAIVDYAHRDQPYYGYVVSTLPLRSGRYYQFDPAHLAELIALPAGTLTQRTMVFAVRIHPEGPASAHGTLDTMLVEEAESHSRHQANIRVQGHHQWDARFQRILTRLPGGLRPQEVVAESWPGQTIVEAAVDCVASWRHSSGHWSAVRRAQPRFGYDMRRGSNGIWYATGIFGN